ncbi:quercetin 2,3-dioxygenase [Bordetella genomosp. 1]|uniref:Quercetin 2,3-dioxygenase n=1 Tax=Bordetella genomosp. 1 TaxID=1395607 RepID=A0A261RXZ9_9BORD|nr:pirin family protein [Bordetella genomosp. 1]OZI29143.1 quercetin 2,3-dioxygenase [Bordetella genomosp. 1]OZI65119.1 quercetin 2,3-dioxygenase [Bordetella genomosp. 1]
MKKVLGTFSAPRAHWVGDGFPVRSLFSYQTLGRQLSPFLLLDYAGPARFEPSGAPRGVGVHPHRGFETVTIVYDGEVAHRDSTGEGGTIGPGDVQWMTAASGILHEEFHSPEFTRRGGALEMVQLWVNLPARDKRAVPGYQSITSDQIARVTLPDNAGSVRVIAGELDGTAGAARTFTPVNVWDARLNAGGLARLPVPAGHNAAVVVLRGTVLLNREHVLRDAQVAVLAPEAEGIELEANNDALVLILSGEPIDEPIVGHGPFVMNTQQEIVEALRDFNEGRFGQMQETVEAVH